MQGNFWRFYFRIIWLIRIHSKIWRNQWLMSFSNIHWDISNNRNQRIKRPNCFRTKMMSANSSWHLKKIRKYTVKWEENLSHRTNLMFLETTFIVNHTKTELKVKKMVSNRIKKQITTLKNSQIKFSTNRSASVKYR